LYDIYNPVNLAADGIRATIHFTLMERGHSTIYTILSVICLGIIIYVVAQKHLFNGQTPGMNILGITANSASDSFMQKSLHSAKDAAGQKALELEQTFLSSAQQEVSSLTKSQVDHLKTQICRDWGVLPAEATPSGTQ
jgi:hypothetical protein